MSRLSSPLCEADHYRRAMHGLSLAYHAADHALLAAQATCPASLEPYQPRLPWLLADLDALGVAQPDFQPVSLNVPSSRSAYLGMRYVLEGAQLGSQVIDRNLARSALGPQLVNAKSFWSRRMASPDCWPILLAQLATLQTRDELTQAARAARGTFHHFLNCLSVVEES